MSWHDATIWECDHCELTDETETGCEPAGWALDYVDSYGHLVDLCHYCLAKDEKRVSDDDR